MPDAELDPSLAEHQPDNPAKRKSLVESLKKMIPGRAAAQPTTGAKAPSGPPESSYQPPEHAMPPTGKDYGESRLDSYVPKVGAELVGRVKNVIRTEASQGDALSRMAFEKGYVAEAPKIAETSAKRTEKLIGVGTGAVLDFAVKGLTNPADHEAAEGMLGLYEKRAAATGSIMSAMSQAMETEPLDIRADRVPDMRGKSGQHVEGDIDSIMKAAGQIRNLLTGEVNAVGTPAYEGVDHYLDKDGNRASRVAVQEAGEGLSVVSLGMDTQLTIRDFTVDNSRGGKEWRHDCYVTSTIPLEERQRIVGRQDYLRDSIRGTTPLPPLDAEPAVDQSPLPPLPDEPRTELPPLPD